MLLWLQLESNGIDAAAAQSDLIWTAAVSASIQSTQRARVEAMQRLALGTLNTDLRVQAVGTTIWTSAYSKVESGAPLEIYTLQDAYAIAGQTAQLVGRTDVGVLSEHGLIGVTSRRANTRCMASLLYSAPHLVRSACAVKQVHLPSLLGWSKCLAVPVWACTQLDERILVHSLGQNCSLPAGLISVSNGGIVALSSAQLKLSSSASTVATSAFSYSVMSVAETNIRSHQDVAVVAASDASVHSRGPINVRSASVELISLTGTCRSDWRISVARLQHSTRHGIQSPGGRRIDSRHGFLGAKW